MQEYSNPGTTLGFAKQNQVRGYAGIYLAKCVPEVPSDLGFSEGDPGYGSTTPDGNFLRGHRRVVFQGGGEGSSQPPEKKD